MNWLDGTAQRVRRLTQRPDRTAAVPGIAVVTDSAAGLPRGWAAAAGVAELVRVVPMPVMIGEQIYGEGTEGLSTSLAVALAEGRQIRTSRPSPGQFETVYRSLAAAGFAGVVSVHISAELSGTAEAARLAAGKVDIPVQVLDSRTVAMSMGFGVIAAAMEAAGGGTLESVAARASAAVAQSSLYFYVPALDQLRRGGRIGATAGLLGTLLAVKPILSVKEGRVVPLERIRTEPKALARLADIVRADAAGRTGPVLLAVHHFGNEEQAAAMARNLTEQLPAVDTVQSRLPAVLAAHAGLGVVAVAVASGSESGPGSGGNSSPGSGSNRGPAAH